MSFVSDLRMNGIYGNPGELGPPRNRGINLDEIGNLLSMVRAHHALSNMNEMQMQPQGGHLSNISQSMNQAPIVPPAYPNTVLTPNTISDLDKAKLGIESAKLGEKKNEFGQNIGEKKAEFSGKQDINQQKVDISSQRADTSQFSANTRRQLAELHDLPDSEKLRLLQEGKVDIQHIRDAASLANIGARGNESRKTLEQRGGQELTNIEAKGNQNRITKQTPSGQAQLPTQTSRAQFNSAQELINTNPNLSKWIHLDPSSKTFTIDQPSEGFFGPSGPNADEYNQIRTKIYGQTPTYNNKPQEKPKEQSNNDNQNMKRPIPGSNKMAISKDGGKTWKVE